MLLFMTIFCSIWCVANAGIFTHGYPLTLSGDGYEKKLCPLTGMGMGTGKLKGDG